MAPALICIRRLAPDSIVAGQSLHHFFVGHKHVHLAGIDQQAGQLVQHPENFLSRMFSEAGLHPVAADAGPEAQGGENPFDEPRLQAAMGISGGAAFEFEVDVVFGVFGSAKGVQDAESGSR